MEEKRKIYVITSGTYSAYRICGVTLDYEKAKIMQKRYWNSEYDGCSIEEYTEDEYADDYYFKTDELIPVWRFSFTKDGEIRNAELVCYTDDKNYNERHGQYLLDKRKLTFTARIADMDQEHAKKITRDARAKMLAEYYELT